MNEGQAGVGYTGEGGVLIKIYFFFLFFGDLDYGSYEEMVTCGREGILRSFYINARE